MTGGPCIGPVMKNTAGSYCGRMEVSMREITIGQLRKSEELHARSLRKNIGNPGRTAEEDMVYALAYRITRNAQMLLESGTFGGREYEALLQAIMAEENGIHPLIMVQVLRHFAQLYEFTEEDYLSYEWSMMRFMILDDMAKAMKAENEWSDD